MSFFHVHFSYVEDNMNPELAAWWLTAHVVILRVLTSPKYRRPVWGTTLSGNLLIQPPKNLIMETHMNGRKPKSSSSRNGSIPVQPASLEWINSPLTPEDYDLLEHDSASLEYLSGVLIGLVGRCYGVSVKFDSERRRYNCTIYRSPSDGNRRHLGLSGFAPDLRDSILVTLYRFNVKCGGELTDSLVENSSNQSVRRFG